MAREPDEMTIEELDRVYGKPVRMPVVTHVLAKTENVNHDRVVIELATDATTRLEIPFTQTALKALMALIASDLGRARPKLN